MRCTGTVRACNSYHLATVDRGQTGTYSDAVIKDEARAGNDKDMGRSSTSIGRGRSWTRVPLSRRQVLQGLAMGGAGVALAGCNIPWPIGTGPGSSLPAGPRPFPGKPAGTDMIPQIDHVVVIMLENHSFDNVLGMLGRGNGFTLGSDGLPTATNPESGGNLVRAFHSPTPCRSFSEPDQTWNDSHESYSNGTNQGFVRASGPAAMAYYDSSDVPFTYGLAKTFPIADQYYSSLLGQTFPNRRYLISGTSLGMINDLPAFDDVLPTVANHPPNGTIFDMLNATGVSWKNYNYGISTLMLYPYLITEPANLGKLVGINQFYADAASGSLPAFSLVDPDLVNFVGNSGGEGDDLQLADRFLSSIVNAVMQGPKWAKTLLVWTFDEAGGYYDHVPPPSAPVPDDVAPQLSSSDVPGSFDRYGFRVPCGVVSPYARPEYVSHIVYDHTSVLKLVETKWNLPAMTNRDASAADMLDMLDMSSPAFSTPPTLPTAPNPSTAAVAACELDSAQTPPAAYVTPT